MSERTPELADIIRQAIEDRLAEVHVMLPGRIDSYDADLQKADVEPMIRRLQHTSEGEISEELPVIPGVPVVFFRAGGFKITTPVAKGDRCMLVFCERSIEIFQTSDLRRGDEPSLISQADPQTFEMHNLSDPVALLGWYNDAEALSTPDSSDMVIGEDGGPVIHIGGDQVDLYEKPAADFVALAQKTFDELKKITDWLTRVDSIIQGPPILETGNGSPSALQLAMSLALQVPPPVTAAPASSVAAGKVKAT